ncbi:hypothetical protein RHODOSMS8_01827 [Rhodobiaceae bacterium]|nr:hypothetical protein RHODOSMS8_01827 [Rhodobiaceae bacterium]
MLSSAYPTLDARFVRDINAPAILDVFRDVETRGR